MVILGGAVGRLLVGPHPSDDILLGKMSGQGSMCRCIPLIRHRMSGRLDVRVGDVLVQEAKLKAAQPYFERTWAKFQEALDQLPEADKGKKLKPVQVCLPCLFACYKCFDCPSIFPAQRLL